MLALHKQLPQVRTPHEQTALERQIEAKGQADRRPGLRAIRADGGGDRDCGGKGMRGMICSDITLVTQRMRQL